MKLVDKKLTELKISFDTLLNQEMSLNELAIFLDRFECLISDIQDLKTLIVNFKYYDEDL